MRGHTLDEMLQAELIIPDHIECWLLQNTTCPRKHTKGAEVGAYSRSGSMLLDILVRKLLLCEQRARGRVGSGAL